jgi:hypothetical protein
MNFVVSCLKFVPVLFEMFNHAEVLKTGLIEARPDLFGIFSGIVLIDTAEVSGLDFLHEIPDI